MSYAPRDKDHLTHNIRLGGSLDVNDVNSLQKELADVVRIKAQLSNWLFEYHKDTYALLPVDRKDMVLTEPISGSDSVKTLVEIYIEQDTSSFPVKLERLPVNDERAPDAVDIDTLVERVKEYTDNKTAINYCGHDLQLFNQEALRYVFVFFLFHCLICIRLRIDIYCNIFSDNKMMNHFPGEFQSNMSTKYPTVWPNTTPTISSEEAKDNKQYLRRMSTRSKVETHLQIEIQSQHSLSEQEMRNGNYTLVKKLLDVLTNKYHLDGHKIKTEVDDIIDRNQHLQNMRVCIYSTKLWYDRETPDRRSYWKELSEHFLERYLVLISFNAYLHEAIKDEFRSKYSEWVRKHPDVLDVLTIKSFNWD
ncbi:hypothetical protein RFI_05413 [Reticulomyxa filosa]|uniref:Uncharacterized protein n=1 Tax=Reticulomyxa filosa TaxID=46433 RepID=X6P2C3_RETFI|nr:hypothetical protein RFI_05413 [Reticulomyxa filosa]|eukprot:ETO31707.1 hypothetical protein RFI_05413 [Reticulomyxa filosa]